MTQTLQWHKQRKKASVNRLNALRATVLGANDGIVSTAGLVIGVTGAAAEHNAILTAGFAGLVAGAISMAAGEYVSVSSQRDTQTALIRGETLDLKTSPEAAVSALADAYEQKGLSRSTAELVATELSLKDPVTAHLDAELNIDASDLTNPWSAAAASAGAFVAGALIPLAAIAFAPPQLTLLFTGLAVVLALMITGTLSAMAGNANKVRAATRVVLWGTGAMVVTYAIGYVIGVNIG